MTLLTVLGLVGFVAYLCGYALVQLGRMNGNGLAYAWTNLAGASLVLASLLESFNLASALTQVTWIVVSTVGISRRALAAVRKTSTSVAERGAISEVAVNPVSAVSFVWPAPIASPISFDDVLRRALRDSQSTTFDSFWHRSRRGAIRPLA